MNAPNYQYPDGTTRVLGDRGTVPLAVRKDLAGPLANADGKYSVVQTDSKGHLRVTSTPSPPKFLPIVAATLGPNIIVPLTVGKRIRVLNYVLAADKKVGAVWTGLITPLSGVLRLNDNVVFSACGGPDAPMFETILSEPLILTLDTAGVVVGGHLAFLEVD